MTGQPPTAPSDGAEGILERFLGEVVADEYANAPKLGVGLAPSMSMVAAVVAGVIGLVIAVSLLNARFSTDERQQTRAELVERVAQGTATLEERQASVDALSARVDALQDDVLAAAGSDPERSAQVDRLTTAAGAAAMSGPGVTITVDDAPTAAAGSLNRVLDRDLQDLANALWRAGAAGVAINGQRLTADSAIRAAGDAILVDYQPLNRPYTLAAVGPSDTSVTTAGITALLSSLHADYGLVSGVAYGDVALSAGDVRDPRFAAASPTASPTQPPQE